MAQPTTPDAPTPNGTAPETPAAVTTPAQDATLLERALFEVKRVIVGQDRMVERMFVALLARGHCLLEGVPGRGQDPRGGDPGPGGRRARSPGCSSPRTWCRPTSSAPGSTGSRARSSTSSSGPVFVNFLLADEINRAPAKVQSALLEVMAERQVSIGGQTHRVPDAVPGDGHPEPDRAGGRLPAAGGAARPLPDEDRRRVPDRRGGAGDRLPDGGAPRPSRRRCFTPTDLLALQTQGRPGLRAQRAGRLRRPAGAGHPQPRPSTACPTWPG